MKQGLSGLLFALLCTLSIIHFSKSNETEVKSDALDHWWSTYNLTNSTCATPRNSTLPYLGHEIFYDYADYYFTPETAEEIEYLNHGSKIFLEVELIIDFAKHIHLFYTSFVLITRSNRDVVVPYYTSERASKHYAAVAIILNSKYLNAWFASNVVSSHPKLIHMPLGSKW